MLLVEIALTIAAWNKGWRAKALLAPAAALVCGAFLGAAMAGGGAAPAGIRALGALVDLALIGVLAFMARRAPAPLPDTALGQTAASSSI